MDLGTLYLVPTPIGHRDDITLRALEVLRHVPVMAAEDTRHTRNLLRTLGIELGQRRLLSYHDHVEATRSGTLLEALRRGDDVALLSDAGTPLVNDPGYRVVAGAIAEGITVRPLPGASATITALIGSGLPVHRFYFLGFLPRKAAARQAELGRIRDVDATLIMFEAPHRIVDTLGDMLKVLGDRPAALACNLSKPDESFIRGPLSGILDRLGSEDAVRGQYTGVVGGCPDTTSDAARAQAERLAASMLRHGADARVCREVVQEVTGLPRNQVYELVRQGQKVTPAGAAPESLRGTGRQPASRPSAEERGAG
ncbi:ribosomal RNA small subunit methyltransferase I [Microtetraspora sp. NBRC 13810]|uniref:16S rRNA (cytidine(1402)-2'-O)-methyltransferase n=1 Tax=Microtetraspora sp. NBRC 13810 TaxID=3030990 RepID=UPI0024A568C6|nr:16S rRNA (cytidine(1402)-2'-O)-methyltransferase [Microtetraspora sp. NBRC 13810]GLW05869.1 ribosomal RNA small subunit methyltransferase I [Microtetraspora sp. NBRC 13810]